MTDRKEFASGRHPKKFTYTYEDLAKLFDMTVGAVRKAAHDNRLDPEDLQSVYEFLSKRNLQPEAVTRAQEQLTGLAAEGEKIGSHTYQQHSGGADPNVRNGADGNVGGGVTLPGGVLCPTCAGVLEQRGNQYWCHTCKRWMAMDAVDSLQDHARALYIRQNTVHPVTASLAKVAKDAAKISGKLDWNDIKPDPPEMPAGIHEPDLKKDGDDG